MLFAFVFRPRRAIINMSLAEIIREEMAEARKLESRLLQAIITATEEDLDETCFRPREYDGRANRGQL